MRILLLALALAACAPGAERDDRPRGPTVSIGGGLSTYLGATAR